MSAPIHTRHRNRHFLMASSPVAPCLSAALFTETDIQTHAFVRVFGVGRQADAPFVSARRRLCFQRATARYVFL